MMENEDVEICCAKALGWKKDEWGLWHLTLPHIKWAIKNNITLSNYEAIGEKNLKFTTSHDWAMLLVKKIMDEWKYAQLNGIPSNSDAYLRMDTFFNRFDSAFDFASKSPLKIAEEYLSVLAPTPDKKD